MKLIYYRSCLVFIISILLLAPQCNPPIQQSESTPISSGVLNYVSFFEEDENEIEHAIINRFQTSYPDINVILNNSNNTSLENYLMQSTPPDVLTAIPNYGLLTQIKQGTILDISNLWLTANLDTVYSPSVQNIATHQGKHYFLPVGFTWNAIYYNKQLFEDYKIQTPTTWDEFLAICELFLANGIIPITLGGEDLWSSSKWFDYLNLRLNGPEFHQALAHGEEKYTDPRLKNTFELWAELLDKEYIPDRASVLSASGAINLMLENKAAMILANPGMITELPNSLHNRFDFFAFPIIDPSLPLAEVSPTYGYIIPANAPNPQTATIFLQHLTTQETITFYTSLLSNSDGLIPIHTDVDIDTYPKNIQQGTIIINKADFLIQPYLFNMHPDMGQPFYIAIRSLLRDTNNLEKALNTLEENREAIYGHK